LRVSKLSWCLKLWTLSNCISSLAPLSNQLWLDNSENRGTVTSSMSRRILFSYWKLLNVCSDITSRC
jgi:hypothetical protein